MTVQALKELKSNYRQVYFPHENKEQKGQVGETGKKKRLGMDGELYMDPDNISTGLDL